MNWLQIAKDAKTKLEALLTLAKAEKRAFTKEEQTSFDADKATADNALAMLAAEAALTGLSDSLTEPAALPDAPAINIRNEQLWGRGPNNGLGNMLQAVAKAARGAGTDERLFHNAGTGGNTQNPEEGGFLVQPDMATGLLKRTYETSQVASRCTKNVVGPLSDSMTYNMVDESSRATGSRWGGIRGYWIWEGGTMTPSQQKIVQKEIKLNKLAGLVYATDEQMQDAPALASSINEDFPKEFSWLLDDAALNGIGAGTPLGINVSSVPVSIDKETNQGAATIVFENITKMWTRMFAPSRANAVWFINQDCENELMTMAFVVGTGGVPVYMPANGISGSPYATLMGRPVIPIEQAKTVGTLGDIQFVDMSQYRIVDKNSLQTASSIHVAFLTNQQAFRFIYRVGGQPIWPSALTPANGTNTLSPFVNLKVRA